MKDEELFRVEKNGKNIFFKKITRRERGQSPEGDMAVTKGVCACKCVRACVCLCVRERLTRRRY